MRNGFDAEFEVKNIIDDITRLTGMNVVRADVVVMDLEDNAEVQEDAGTEESSVLSAASFVE